MDEKLWNNCVLLSLLGMNEMDPFEHIHTHTHIANIF